jgi:alpha-mannosidase
MGKTESASYFKVSAENVILETVKPAEDGSKDTILRLYESKNTYTKFNIDFGFDIREAYITNMLEENQNKLEIENNSLTLELKPFEIITVKAEV